VSRPNPQSQGQVEAKAGWPVVRLRRWGHHADGGDIASYSVLRPGVDPPPEPHGREGETYLPESAVTGLVEALEGAESFIERVEKWAGTDECEQAEALEEIQAALASYKARAGS
jgi:hypothetical protein